MGPEGLANRGPGQKMPHPPATKGASWEFFARNWANCQLIRFRCGEQFSFIITDMNGQMCGAHCGTRERHAARTLSHTIRFLIRFRESTPQQNRQRNVYYY